MSIRSAAIWAMAAQYAAFAIQFLVSVIISRFFLTPAEVGLFSIALAAALLISVLQDFGLNRYIAGSGMLDAAHLRVCSSVAFLFSLAIAGLIAACAWPAAIFYGDMRLVPLLLIIASSYLLVPFSIVPSALLTRDMDFRALFVVNVGGAFANGGFALLLAAMGFSAYSLAWAMVAQAAMRAVIAQWQRPAMVPFPLQLKGAAEVVRFGSASSALIMCGALGVRSADLIVGRLQGLTGVGLFSRADSLAGQLRMLVAGAIGAVFYPAFAKIRDQGLPLGPPYQRVVAGYTAVIWPAMTGLAAAAQPLVLVLYGERWEAVAPLLMWIAFSEMCFVALPLHTELPILLGRIGILIAFNLCDTIASVLLLVIGARWGIEWAAMSRLAYGLVWIGIYARFLRKLIGFEWRSMLAIYLRSGLATLAAVTPMLLAYRFWRTPAELGLDGLLLTTAAGVLCWLATLFIVRHPVVDEITAIFTDLFNGLKRAFG